MNFADTNRNRLNGRRVTGLVAAAAEFRSVVNLVNLLVDNIFCRELICMAAVPGDLGWVRLAHENCVANCVAQRNRPAPQFQNQHGPLIVMKPAQMRDVVVGELTDRRGVASDRSGR